MKIHAFRLEQQGPGDLLALMDAVRAMPLEDRFFAGDGRALRLEARGRRGDFYLMDFAGPRGGHGPGRMAPSRPITEFDLQADESFGEDTAIALHIPTGYVAVQYNHYGPRAATVDRYFNAADLEIGGHAPTTYTLAACLRPDAYRRLAEMGFMQEVEFTIALPGILPGDADRGLSVEGALAAPLPEGVQIISMQLRAMAGAPIGRAGVMGLIDSLTARGAELRAARVWGKRAEGLGRKRPVDLVNDHLSNEVDIRTARGQRIARAERWQALTASLTGWLAAGQLQAP